MSFTNTHGGRGYLAIPGPSVMPDAVLQSMHRASPNIYEGALIDMMPELVADLKRVARTDHDVAIYIGNGHAAWEAALSNVIAPGDTVLVPATGMFGHSWGGMATGIGAQVEVMDFGKSAAIDLTRLEEQLTADKAHKIKAILAVHVDTSSSVRNDMSGVRAALDAAGHPALLMADCIASMGCDVFEMDAWGVDVAVTACQKGLMVPPGVSFVYFGPRAAEVRAKMPRVSNYWDWEIRADAEEFWAYFGGTAPTHHLYGLRTALDMIHGEGIENVWARHETLARAIWAAGSVWAEGGSFHFNIKDPAQRSHAVTALRVDPPMGTALRRWTQTNLGLTLGIGLGMAEQGDPARDGFFRLGHMGHVNGQMIMGLLGGMEAGMRSLGIAHGRGALEAAAEVIAAGSAAPGVDHADQSVKNPTCCGNG